MDLTYNSIYRSLRWWYHTACRRLGVDRYAIHRIHLPERQLLYIPIPKNACSSIKHALYEIENGKAFDYEKKRDHGFRDIHDYFEKREGAFTGLGTLRDRGEEWCFAVVRDPVSRLISCYRNRVLDLKDLEACSMSLEKMGLPVRPDLDTFVLNLERYREASQSIDHHARAQHEFLGGTMDYLDRVFPIEQLDELIEKLREYDPELVFRQAKSGGTPAGLKDMSEEALEHALSYYEKDYELLGTYYTPEKVRDRFREQSAL